MRCEINNTRAYAPLLRTAEKCAQKVQRIGGGAENGLSGSLAAGLGWLGLPCGTLYELLKVREKETEPGVFR